MDLAGASDAVAETHAGYVVAGIAFKIVLLAVFGFDESHSTVSTTATGICQDRS
jgi:hypothetical protein